jgi:hypothetical protein
MRKRLAKPRHCRGQQSCQPAPSRSTLGSRKSSLRRDSEGLAANPFPMRRFRAA